jgi:hypothetical protein
MLRKKQRPKQQHDNSEVTEQESDKFLKKMLRADAEPRATGDYNASSYTQ